MAEKGHLILNDVPYFLEANSLERDFIPPFGPVQRPTGQHDVEGLTQSTLRRFGPWLNGFGRHFIPSELTKDGTEYRKFWDSTIDTRWPAGAVLAILENDASGELEVIRASCNYGGNLWTLWQDDTATDIKTRKFVGSSTTWTAGGDVIAAASAQNAFDIINAGAIMVALYQANTNHLTRYSTDGVTWSLPTTAITSGMFADNPSAHEDVDGGLLAVIGNEIAAVVWNEDNLAARVFSTPVGTSLVTWVPKIEDDGIPAATGIKGVAVYAGTEEGNPDHIYVGTDDGLYDINPSATTWTYKKVDLPVMSHPDNFRRMTAHNGALWFPLGVDDNSPARIVRMTVEGRARNFEFGWGLDVEDGIPDDMLGPVMWMKSVGNFLFISVGGGAANRKARILCHNGIGWHHMHQDGTANQAAGWFDISNYDDATPRLIYSKRTAAGTTTTHYQTYPLTNPWTAGVAVARETSGILDLPYIDGGMPQDFAVWLRMAINTRALDGTTKESIGAADTGNYISATFGADVDTRTGTSIGNFFSATPSRQMNVSGKALGVRLTLEQEDGSTDSTPVLRSGTLEYFKQPARLERFTFKVNLEKSSKLISGNIKTVVSNLKTARDKATLPNFYFGSDSSDMSSTSPRFVKVTTLRFAEQFAVTSQTRVGGPQLASTPHGQALVIVEELRGSET